MAILEADIQYRFSGGASNSDPLLSLGGEKSSVESGSVVFDDVPSAEALAGSVEYRGLYIHNAHATKTYILPKVWIQANTPSPTTEIAIGLGTSALNATEQTIANETTAPVGVTFLTVSDEGTGIELGSIPAGQSRFIWLRRTVNAGTAAVNDSATIRTKGDSNP